MGVVSAARAAFTDRQRSIAESYRFGKSGLTNDPELVAVVQAVIDANQAEESAFDTESAEREFVNLVESGVPRLTAAKRAGFDVYTMARRLRVDKELLDRVRTAEQVALEPSIEHMIRLANDGEEWAVKYILTRKNPEEFAEPPRQVLVQQNLTVETKGNLGYIDRQILELEAALKERAALQAGDDVVAELAEIVGEEEEEENNDG